MNKKIISIITLLHISIASSVLSADEATDTSALKAEAISIVQTFGGTLKPKLKAAIQSGGLEHAIEICSAEAPRIASELSEQTGWNVKRVSLKPRNRNSASANTFEQAILEQFNKRQTEGESPATIAHAEVVDNQFRFMKAQPVEAICLNCHGQAVLPEVQKTIKRFYPDDVALGYSLGQIRGAFSLTKDL